MKEGEKMSCNNCRFNDCGVCTNPNKCTEKENKGVNNAEWENQKYDEELQYWTATCGNCGYISSDPFIITGSHLYCERCGAKMKF